MKKYSCPNCSAELFWDAAAGCLKCEYCEGKFTVDELDAAMAKADAARGVAEKKPEAPSEKVAREANEQDKAVDESTKIDTSDLVVYSCSNCGAEVITSKSTIATTCAFCGRAISLTNKMVGNFKPDCVIPFAITEDEAKSIYKKYTTTGPLTPKAFSTENVIEKMKGVYVPFWLHSYDETAHVVVSAENTHSHKRGYDKVIDHEMFMVDMDVSGKFESIPTDGLKNLDDALMGGIEPFDYSRLTAFNPAFMAGYYAEEYDETAKEKEAAVHERTASEMKSDSIKEAGPYMEKLVTSYSPSYQNENAKYAMLPVWLFNVDYKGKLYQFAINGETGKVTGKLPISKLKAALYAGGGFLGTQIIALLIRLFAM